MAFEGISAGAWGSVDGVFVLGGPAAAAAPDDTIYSADGTLAANRQVTTDGKTLLFHDSGTVHKVQFGGTTAHPERHAVVGTSSASAAAAVYRYSNGSFGPKLVAAHARGTEASPLALASGDMLGRFMTLGYDSAFFFEALEMRAVTSENWTAGAHGCEWEWYTIANGGSSKTKRMTLGNDGVLDVVGAIKSEGQFVDAKGIKTINVYSESDFGTFAANKVDLVNAVYVLKNDIALSSGGLNVPTGVTANIRSDGRAVHTLTYTNASSPLFASAGSGNFRVQDFDVVFNSGTQDIFNLVGDGANSLAVDRVEISVTANAGSGLVHNYDDIHFSYVEISDSSDELLVKDCDAHFSDSHISNTVDTSAALIGFETTAAHTLHVFNSKLLPLSGEAVLRISSGTQHADSRVLASDLLTGDPLGLLFDASGLDETDPRVFSQRNPGRRSSGTYGEANLDGNTATTIIPAVDAWVRVLATTWVADEKNRITVGTDGVLTHTGLEPTRAKLDGNLVLEPVTATKTIASTFVKVGVEAISVTFDNAPNFITAAGLSAGDTISFTNTPGTLPAELRKDVIYYVIVGAGTQLSYTSGGAAVTFTDNGTGPNTLDRAEFHGSRSPVSISSGGAIEIIAQALAEISPGEKVAQFIRNRTDAVNIDVLDGYSRI